MKLKHLYIALGLSALLTSCKDDEPVVMPVQEVVKIPVSFTIKLASESDTRAEARIGTWDEGEDPSNDRNGTSFENTINSLTPVLYLTDYRGIIDEKNPIAVLDGSTTLTSTDIIPSDADATGQTFDVSGKMICSGLTSSQLVECQDRLRLAIFINCAAGDVMNPLDITKPAQATFNHHGKPDDHKDPGSKRFQGIPMYGVTGVSFFKEKDSQDNDVYTVYAPNSTEQQKNRLSIPILRSMAKVNVKLAVDGNNKIDDKVVELKKLEISRHAVKGYVVPKGWDNVTSVTSLNLNGAGCNPLFGNSYKGEDYNHSCYVEPQTNYSDLSDEHKNDSEYRENTKYNLRFYLPDTYNCANDGDDNSPEIYMELTYTVDGTEYKHPLFFRLQNQWPRADGKDEYSDDDPTIPTLPDRNKFGSPWDIIRNHIYEFVIEGVEATTGNLTVNVSVKDWVTKHYDLKEDDVLVSE